MRRVADDVLACAARRRLHDSVQRTRCCCRFEQRRCDGRFGQCKIFFDCCSADACVRAAMCVCVCVCLIDWVVATWRFDIG